MSCLQVQLQCNRVVDQLRNAGARASSHAHVQSAMAMLSMTQNSGAGVMSQTDAGAQEGMSRSRITLAKILEFLSNFGISAAVTISSEDGDIAHVYDL